MRLCYSIVMFMALLALVSGVTLIAGCGKKGALYHPPEVIERIEKEKAQKAQAEEKAMQKTQTINTESQLKP